MSKVESLKKLCKRLFNVEPTGDTVSKVLDNIGVGTKEIILNSSTASSTKKFKITVVDNGTIAATEVTD